MDFTTQSTDRKLQTLRTWNWAMFALHAVQGVAILTLSSGFALPLTTAFVQYSPYTERLEPFLHVFRAVHLGPMVAGFLFLSAAAHLVNALGFRWYGANVKRGINPMRWLEYGLSSSLMMVVIALLVGIYDVVTLMVLFGLNTSMILFGWMMELHNQTTKKTNWTSFTFGSVTGIISWIGVAIYLLGAGNGFGEVPTFVYWVYISIFLFFNCFAVNMVLQYKKLGRWSDYLYGERAYMILSLVAKSLLAWQVFAGTLRPV